ncbi:replicative DNA helicase [Paenibacillus polymyxa]|uniref:replicative DNA helicase n=1 Tax=Paenibacillus polymyxa TaxID=1406 RepID=UPI00287F7307|nr:replicative DNA helicase [Paenibacillus polymyxa]
MQGLGEIELPYNLETEQAVLGAMLIDADSVEIAANKLGLDAFFDAGHRLIFQALADLHESQEPIDLVTVTNQLQNNGQLADVGGVGYLAKLAQGLPTTLNTGYYVAQLEDTAIRREFIRTSMLQIQQAAAGTEVPQLLASMHNSATKLSDRAAPEQDFKPIKDVMIELIETTETKATNLKNGIVTGLPTGYVDLDSITGGLQQSDLIIVAARPSVGKTAFALNISQNIAVQVKETVAIFSLEMSAGQLAQRMASAEGHLDASAMKSGDLKDDDWEKLADAVGTLGNTQIFVDDSPGITIQDICSKCRRLKKEHGLALIVIDYLQLIEIAGRKKSAENRQQEVSMISRTLKHLARELDVPIIALSQLSRAVEQRQDKRPMMSDLRESGSIEQDADIVAFLYRDDYYNQDTERKNIIEIIIGKQRNGPVGTVELVFLKNYNKFANYERAHSEYQPAAPHPQKNSKRQWSH